MNGPPRESAEHFYSLDVLRGIAALSVVFWHWKHFYFVGTILPPDLDETRQPFYAVFRVLYNHGDKAVDLFFALSGFIFYWLYAQRISDGQVPVGRFAWLRFSRLYPLHLATLLFVTAAQALMLRTQGSYFVYPYNDLWHFLLNLTMSSAWGFEKGASYNGPFWSVSVEVLLYAVFYAVCRLLPVRCFVVIPLMVFGLFYANKHWWLFGRGLGSFFMGGCIYLLYLTLLRSKHVRTITRAVAGLAILCWIASLLIAHFEIDLATLAVRSVPAQTRWEDILYRGLRRAQLEWLADVLFPLTILALALVEKERGTLGKRAAWIGHLSYSSYLLHFPLQMMFAFVVAQFALDPSIYDSPWCLFLFFALLVPLSLASYRYFEAPAQNYLRSFGASRRD